MKIVTASGNEHVNIETLKTGVDTISKTQATLYTKYLSERLIHTAWINANDSANILENI